MTTIYNKIQAIDSEIINGLIQTGFLKPIFKRNIAIYENYLMHLQQGYDCTSAVVCTSENFGITDRQVFRIIKLFSKVAA